MSPDERRSQDPFLEHLSESEKRLGAGRNAIADALIIGVIAAIIVAGAAVAITRIRMPQVDRSTSFEKSAVTPPVAAPAPPAAPAPATAPAAVPATAAPPRTDERPYIDASKPGRYTISDPKVQVEINTLSEKDRDAKLEQLKKEGLLTEKEAQELKSQKPPR